MYKIIVKRKAVHLMAPVSLATCAQECLFLKQGKASLRLLNMRVAFLLTMYINHAEMVLTQREFCEAK